MNSGSFKNKSRIFCSSLTYRFSFHMSSSFSPYNNASIISLMVTSPLPLFPICRICIAGTPSVLFHGWDTRNDCIFGKTAFQLSYQYVVVRVIIKTGEASVHCMGTRYRFCQQNVKEKIGSVEMFKKLERLWGFFPRHLAPPQCDNPREGNNSTIALRRGGPGGQALSPPLKRVSFFLCYDKRNSTEPKNKKKFWNGIWIF